MKRKSERVFVSATPDGAIRIEPAKNNPEDPFELGIDWNTVGQDEIDSRGRLKLPEDVRKFLGEDRSE